MKRFEELVYRALIKEVELTPKPGLVDRNNNGSHRDMSIDTFYKSSRAIKPFMRRFYVCGKEALHVEGKVLFQRLKEIGKECEKEMYLATGGVNTHKGIVFSFAVIFGALGRLEARYQTFGYEQLQNEIKEICQGLVKRDLLNNTRVTTSGERLFKETKYAGIRDEAQNGYPLVFQYSLPFYAKQEQLYGEDVALKLTLLFIMSRATDSNIFARGGVRAMKFVRLKSKILLDEADIKNLDKKLIKFDKEMIGKNLSAGGSADLLCLTWFLSKVDL
ncbi:MAG: triphosphoribosyl-dephospho-CoA synthase CitG [Sulfurospirillum sp.]